MQLYILQMVISFCYLLAFSIAFLLNYCLKIKPNETYALFRQIVARAFYAFNFSLLLLLFSMFSVLLVPSCIFFLLGSQWAIKITQLTKEIGEYHLYFNHSFFFCCSVARPISRTFKIVRRPGNEKKYPRFKCLKKPSVHFRVSKGADLFNIPTLSHCKGRKRRGYQAVYIQDLVVIIASLAAKLRTPSPKSRGTNMDPIRLSLL